MIAPEIEQLRSIKDFPTLVKYLREKLDWPIDESMVQEDMVFEYAPEEVGLDEASAVKIDRIVRLRSLVSGQPWGIFYINFKPGKLPITVLRRVLRALVIKKRESARDRQAWQRGDLLFLSTLGESESRHISLAHFSEDGDGSGRAVLRVVDWDEQDTHFHLLRNVEELHRLCWPRDTTDVESWRNTWGSAFVLKPGEVITTSKQLAVEMARLARVIRSRVNAAMAIESAKGPLRRMYKAFQEVLLHDLKEDDFADMYAQTITYGLFAARRSRPMGITVENARDMVPNTNPFLRDLLAEFTEVGGITKTLDFDELGIDALVEMLNRANMEAIVADFGDKNPQEDPVIHFYQLFLKEYDAKKKAQRGVFFTPRPVVSFIVRSVDEILRTEFGLEDGLADTTTWGEMQKRHPDLKLPAGATPDTPFVQILDPAVGTGTFLVEAIALIHHTMTEKWLKQGHMALEFDQLWNEYVPKHLLPRLCGFELMMAPYAIAHMKIGLKLDETGYRFASDERLRIYLTNTLEEPKDFSGQFEIMAPALAHEAQAVNAIKREQRFTVVIGNPPYSHLSSNLTAEVMAMVEPYKFINGERIRERGALSLQKNLQDDYVKFIRLSQQCIDAAAVGIVGLITNNSYMDSRSFRGMRFQLSQTFSKAWLLDLHGSGKKEEHVEGGRDENVFDIMQGVAISLWLRCPAKEPSRAFRRADILGPRQSKYTFLASRSVAHTDWQNLDLTPPFYPYVQQDTALLEEYQRYASIREVFPIYSSGVKTHRDKFAYSFVRDEADERLRDFCDARIPGQALRARFGLKDTNVWKLGVQRRKVQYRTLSASVRAALYRPFDIRWACYSDEILELTRRAIMDQMLDGTNVALLCSQQQAEEGFRHVFCTRLISDWGSVSNRTRESTSAFPLWIQAPIHRGSVQPALRVGDCPQANVAPLWMDILDTPEAVFQYVYAILHSPTYRTRYAAFLRTDFPRIPLAGNKDMRRQLVSLGAELSALHLMESSTLDRHMPTPVGSGAFVVSAVSHSEQAVWLHNARTQGFRGVPEEVWNFHIGGYQVCEKWLKDRRGRTLSEEDIRHYQRIIVAIGETIRLMGDIDAVIEEHGGWPLPGGVPTS